MKCGTLCRPCRGTADGFTLVELLVVIAIIGILVGLLMPAIQYARETGRRNTCVNNLKQLGDAALHHEEELRFLPSGGWGWGWVGDPDRGFGANQPGGWLYSILPYLDQRPLHDLGMYQPRADKKSAALKMIQTALPVANCPTRRRAVPFEMDPEGSTTLFRNFDGMDYSADNNKVARTDYAACAGSAALVAYWAGPEKGADTPAYRVEKPFNQEHGGASGGQGSVYSECTGVIFECSQVRVAQIKDGSGNTILLGEKYLNPAFYSIGKSGFDNKNMYVGMDGDVIRCTAHAPLRDHWTDPEEETQQDKNGLSRHKYFGSAHPNSCNFIFCDGSIRRISYTINPDTFRALGSRSLGSEGKEIPVDGSKIE